MTTIKNSNTKKLDLISSLQRESLKDLQTSQLDINQLNWRDHLYHRFKGLFKNFQSLVDALLSKKNKSKIEQTFTRNKEAENNLSKKLDPNGSLNNRDSFSFLKNTFSIEDKLINTSSNKEALLELEEKKKRRILEKKEALLEFEERKKISALKKDYFYKFFNQAQQEPSRENLSRLNISYNEKELAKAAVEAFRPHLHKPNSLSTPSYLMKRNLNKRIGSYRRTRVTRTSRVIHIKTIRRRR